MGAGIVECVIGPFVEKQGDFPAINFDTDPTPLDQLTDLGHSSVRMLGQELAPCIRFETSEASVGESMRSSGVPGLLVNASFSHHNRRTASKQAVASTGWESG